MHRPHRLVAEPVLVGADLEERRLRVLEAERPVRKRAGGGVDLKQRIGFTKDEESRLVDLDYAYLAKNDAAMKEWWDKVFKA